MLAPAFGFGQTYDISDEQAREDLGRLAVMVLSYAAQSARGLQQAVVPQREVDQGGTLAEKFLIRWKGEADPKHVKAIDAYWSSAAEHGMNASTFTARVITSTGADVAAAFSGAIGAMSGPLHGGAPARVLTMIEEVEKSGDAEAYVKEPARLRRAADGLRPPRLPGRGPAGPRAPSYGARAQRAALRGRRGAGEGGPGRARARRPDRVLETNVEFWAAIVLDFAEVPANMFTSMFTCARTGGWSAHILEQKKTGRLIRPVGDLRRPAGPQGRRGRRLAGRVGPVAEPADRFAGRSAIVTGAGSGIGAALSRALVEAGAHVVCADLDLDAAARRRVVVHGPGSARAVALDVTDAGAVAALVASVAAEHGALDLMFNNAGISIGGETEELTLDHWNSIIDVNIRGVVHGVHAAYPLMVRAGQRSHRQHRLDGRADGGRAAHVVRHDQARGGRAVAGAALRGGRARRRRDRGLPVGGGHPDPRQGRGRAVPRARLLPQGPGRTPPARPGRSWPRRCCDAVAENQPLLVTPRTARIAWRIGRLSPSFVACVVDQVRRQAAQAPGQAGWRGRSETATGGRAPPSAAG